MMMMMVPQEPGSRPFPLTVTGTATAQNIEFSSVREPIASTTEKLIALDATGTDSVYGKVTITLDTSRKATPATIRSNQQKQEFPATGNINFHATLRLESQPGAVYRNREEIRIQDRNLRTLRPHAGANYALLEPVTFVNINGADSSALVMTDLKVRID